MKQTLSKIKFIILLTLPVLLLNSCSEDNPISNFNLFSIKDDVELGKQLDNEIISNPSEYPIYEDASAQAYVDGIIAQILKSDDIKYDDEFKYQIRIIDKEVINAFAAPGGYLYVYTGLIKFLDNEASLAAVLAHEAGHCEARHATERMTKAYGVQVMLGVILGNNPGVYEEIAANLLQGLAFLKNSREDEYESDELSFTYLMDTEWWAGASMFFFNKIKQQQGSGSTLEELLSTHPMPDNRVEAVQEMIDEANIGTPQESELFTNRYQQFKSSLK